LRYGEGVGDERVLGRVETPVPDAARLEAAFPRLPERLGRDPAAVEVREHGLSGLGAQRAEMAQDVDHGRMEFDAPARRVRLRLAHLAEVVRRHHVGDALAQVDVVPRQRRCLTGPRAMPPKEEHEGMERGMRAPDEMMLECLRRAGQVWTWPALRCMHRRRAWAGGSELAEGCVALRDGRVVVTREVPGAYREVRK